MDKPVGGQGGYPQGTFCSFEGPKLFGISKNIHPMPVISMGLSQKKICAKYVQICANVCNPEKKKYAQKCVQICAAHISPLALEMKQIHYQFFFLDVAISISFNFNAELNIK